MDLFKKILIIISLLILSYPGASHLFVSGYFPMHDDTQPTRVFEMYKALKDGQFPVRWSKNLGYGFGYPIFNFYAPLPYYVGAAFMYTGHDAVSAAKIMFYIGFILSGISMYFLARQYWGDSAAVLSSLLYIYAPYHAAQVYIRGAVGEYWAYAFLPLVFLGFTYIDRKMYLQGIVIGSLALFGVFLSHNISSLLLFTFILVWIVIGIFSKIDNKRHNLLNIFAVLLLGLGLSAFFWMPALFETRYTNAASLIKGGNDYQNHFLYLDQLWYSPWGFAGSAPGRNDGMSFQLGKLHFAFGLTGLIVTLVWLLKKRHSDLKFFGFIIGMLLISTIMTLTISLPVWKILPFYAYIQFPWRFLSFILFSLSFFSGGIFVFLRNKITLSIITEYLIVFILSGLVVLFYEDLFKPIFIGDVELSRYTNERNIKWDISRISDEYLPPSFIKPTSADFVAERPLNPQADLSIKINDDKTHFIDLTVTAQSDKTIQTNIAHFPGWNVYIDNQMIDIGVSEGKLTFSLPRGNHTVKFILNDTPVRKIANIITLVAIFILLDILIRLNYSENQYEKKD